jgi:hypothetical protein
MVGCTKIRAYRSRADTVTIILCTYGSTTSQSDTTIGRTLCAAALTPVLTLLLLLAGATSIVAHGALVTTTSATCAACLVLIKYSVRAAIRKPLVVEADDTLLVHN